MSRNMYKLRRLSRSELVIRTMCAAVILVYLYCVFSVTLIDRTAGIRGHVLTPFWEVRSMLQSREYTFWSCQIAGNLVMLFPLGLLLPILSERFKNIRSAAISGFLLSLFIESAQYCTDRGLFEFDDLMNNTIGACAGCLFYIFVLERVLADKEEIYY